MLKKSFLGVALGLTLLASGLFTESVGAKVYGVPSGKNFKESWFASYSPTSASLIKFGFNTFLINEDYTWTTSSTAKTWAYVHNNNGSFSDSASKGKWAKIEVRHAGNSPTYEIRF